MPTLVNNLRAIRGPVTAVPVTAGSGIEIAADTQNNQIVISTNLEAGSGIEIVDDNGKAKIINSDNAQALPIVAGTGVKLSAVNNQVVVSADETVLFNNPSFASADLDLGTTFQLSELASNFERIRISWCRWNEAAGKDKTDCNDCTEYDMKFGSVTRNRVTAMSMFYAGTNEADPYLCGSLLTGFADGTTITCAKGWQMVANAINSLATSKIFYRPWKVVGINRIANN